MTSKQFIQNLWRWKCGIPELPPVKPISLTDLKKSEWNTLFEQLMRNRLIIGALRYGKLLSPGKPKYDRVNSMIKRLNAYQQSGNKEHLVDVANLSMLEFTECHHPRQHFQAIDDGEHVKTI